MRLSRRVTPVLTPRELRQELARAILVPTEQPVCRRIELGATVLWGSGSSE